MTAEELYALPDDGLRYELASGHLVCREATRPRHGLAATELLYLIRDYLKTHRIGMCVGTDVGFLLDRHPDTVRAPDIAFVAARRIPAEGIPDSCWTLAPDLAVEVLSPSNRPADVRAKLAEYFAAGTRLVWIVDPTARTIDVHRPSGRVRTLGPDDDLTGGDVLPGFRCTVRQVFAEVDAWCRG